MAANATYTWFEDRRPGCPLRSEMQITLLFHTNGFCGIGADYVGPFVIENGRLDIQNNTLKFVKAYLTHTVDYTGVVESWNTPFKANGRWQLTEYSNVTGKWGMIMQVNPCHASLPNPEHPIRSSLEEWGHTILSYVPIQLVATSWDGGATLFYALTGNAKKAEERMHDLAVDVPLDVPALISRGLSKSAVELYSIFFLAVATELKKGQTLPDLTRALGSGIAAISAYGGDSLGDRTMLDALDAIHSTLSQSSTSSSKDTWPAAAKAAEDAAQRTSTMRAQAEPRGD